jgi:hypothetical protein
VLSVETLEGRGGRGRGQAETSNCKPNSSDAATTSTCRHGRQEAGVSRYHLCRLRQAQAQAHLCGRVRRWPASPAASSNEAMEAACPTARVPTGQRMYCNKGSKLWLIQKASGGRLAARPGIHPPVADGAL